MAKPTAVVEHAAVAAEQGRMCAGKPRPAVHVASAHDVEARGMQWTDGVPSTGDGEESHHFSGTPEYIL